MKNKLTSTAGIFTAVFISANLLFFQKAGAQIPIANEVWISTNANGNVYGVGGAWGTLDSPLDGSSQANFDQNMRNIPPNSTIHILAGTYQTLGSDTYAGSGWWAKSYQKIIGSGMGVTVLQFPSNAIASGAVDNCMIINTYGLNCTNVEVSDMTLDDNYQSGANVTLKGIDLTGTQNAIRRVQLINAASFDSNNAECFGISLENDTLNESDGNVIEDCEVSHFVDGPGYLSAICFLGSGTMSGIIRGNRVYGNGNSYSATQVTGMGSGSHDCLNEGNYIRDCSVGCHMESGCTNMIFAHNHFVDCGEAFLFSIGSRQNVTFAFNDIIETNAPFDQNQNGAVAFEIENNPGFSNTNITIFGNTVSFDGSASSAPYLEFMEMNNITGLIVANNTVDSRLTNYLNNCSNVNMYNNFDLFGNYLSGMNMANLGGTPVTSFGLSLVSSAGASPALVALGLPSNPLVIVTNNSTQSVTFNTNVTVDGMLNYSNMVAQLLAGTGITTSTVNTSTGQVVTVNANSQTNAVIWNSLTVTNSANTNWATFSVTPSNAVISVQGVNVAILGTNGVLNAYNGLSTSISNTSPAVSVTPGASPFFWTNTTSQNLVVYIDQLSNGKVGYNGSFIFTVPSNPGLIVPITVMLQPKSYLSITNGGSYGFHWHIF